MKLIIFYLGHKTFPTTKRKLRKQGIILFFTF